MPPSRKSGISSAMTASCSGETPAGQLTSAAMPSVWKLCSAPPTALLCRLQRKPLVMDSGLPMRSRSVCRASTRSGWTAAEWPQQFVPLQANSERLKFLLRSPITASLCDRAGIRVDGHHGWRLVLRRGRGLLVVGFALGLGGLVARALAEGVLLEFEFAEIASAADAVADRVAVVDAGKLPAHALDLDVLLGA